MGPAEPKDPQDAGGVGIIGRSTESASGQGRSPGQLATLVSIVFLLSLCIRLPLLGIPFERDEGEYAYIAWRMGYHEVPYRDWVDQKPPAIFWAYRLALWLPGDAVRAAHLTGALCAAAAASALFLLARRFVSNPWAAFAGVLLGVLSAHPCVQGTAANTEVFMLLPLILSLLVFLAAVSTASAQMVLIMLAGALTGVAAAFKQVAAINWLFLILVYPLMARGEKLGRRTALFALWSLVGGAAVWALFACYFVAHKALPDLVHNVLTHNLEYVGGLSWKERLVFLGKTLRALAVPHAVLWLYAVAGVVNTIRQRRWPWAIFLALWLLTSSAGVSASGYFFPHYFQQLLPALCLAAAVGGAALATAPLARRVPAWFSSPLLFALPFVSPGVTLVPFLCEYSPQETVTRIYPGNQFARMPELGQRLAQITQPEDRVFVFGAEPELLFYARRASATRYIFLFPVYGPYAHIREKQVATSKEVFQARPTAVFFLPNNLFFAPGTEQYFTKWSVAFVRTFFIPDRWLLVDEHGASSVQPAKSGADFASAPANAVGILFVRKP
jgi:hypothetical protein